MSLSGGSLAIAGSLPSSGGAVSLTAGSLNLSGGGSLTLGGTCASGSAAYTELQAALTNVPAAPGEPAEMQAPSSSAPANVEKPPAVPLGLPGIELSYALDGTDTPTGHLVEITPGLVEPSFFLAPSGTPGAAVLLPAVHCRACQ